MTFSLHAISAVLAPNFLLAPFCLASPAAFQPDVGQQALIERGYGMFIHFGVSTFSSLERTRWAARSNTASLTLSPKVPFLFDRISIHGFAEMETLADGVSQIRKFRTQQFFIAVWQNGQWNTIHSGTEIGVAKVIRLSGKISAERLRLRITKAGAPPGIHLITVTDRTTRKPR